MLRYFTVTGRFMSKMYAMVCVFGCEEKKISGRMLKKYTALSLEEGDKQD